MKKKIFVLSMCLLLTCGCNKIPTLKNGEEAVIKLDGKKISVDDLYGEMKDKYALYTLISMIDKTILEKEYKDKIAEAKSQAESQISSLKGYYGDDLESAIQSQTGYSTIEAYQEYLQISYLQNLAITDYAKTKVTDKEIKDYYKKEIVGDIKCSHILITPDVTDKMTDAEKTKAENEALEEAKDIIKKLKKSTDISKTFTSLAKKYSDDQTTATKGGNLGYFNKGDMTTEFETAAYALKDGTYTTTPVKTTYGYHIILRVATKDKAKLEDVKDEIISSVASNLITDNPVYQVDAMTELRKEYGMEIIDSDLKTQYATYIQNSITKATSSDSTEN